MSGLLLRLAAPLQSWGEHSTFDERDTQPFPTRSGMIGLLAAALGLRRGDSLEAFEPFRFTVRVDRPGIRLTDFHTVGGGHPTGLPTADGKRRPAGQAIISRRAYLSDAAFTVAIDVPGTPSQATTAFLGHLGDRLAAPHWPPYLGRRACPPAGPLMLATRIPDPVHLLRTRVPLARRSPRQATGDSPSVQVLFVHEPAFGQFTNAGQPGGGSSALLWDNPRTFGPSDHRYTARSVERHTELMPARLCSTGPQHLRDLAEFRDSLRSEAAQP